jgi:hypothetical protein
MKAFFKCRACQNPSVAGHIAWCAFQPLVANDAVREPAEPVFFEFGRTEAEAITKLKAGLDEVTEWERQPV